MDLGRGDRPWSDGGLRDQKRYFGYVEISTDDGITGFCPYGANEWVVENELKPVLVGEDPRQVEALWTRMNQSWRHPKMDDMITISTVDIALWDLYGKVVGQPVWRLLGGARDKVRAYGAGGMYQRDKGIPELVAEMVDFVEHGFQAVKMKIAGAPLAEDVARVRAVRKAIGPNVDLMIDANHNFTSYEAIRFARAVEDCNVFWFEEPVNPWDHKGCAEVARVLEIPVATGENVSSRYGFRDMIDERACDIVQADALYCGGLTEYRKIAAYAEAHNLPMAPHGSAHVGAVCVAAMANGLIVEVGMYAGRKTVRPAIVAPLEVKDSFISMSEEPGIGWRIDRDAIAWNMANHG